MIYLFETKHFLIREKTTETDANKNLPETLIAESRTTGIPVGEITVKYPAGPEQEKVLCCLYGKFQQHSFEKEIVDAIKAIL